jgi:hypothetical protein
MSTNKVLDARVCEIDQAITDCGVISSGQQLRSCVREGRTPVENH